MAKITIAVDRNCVPVGQTDKLQLKYRTIMIRGRKSAVRYNEVLYGHATPLDSCLGHIRNRTTMSETLVADFIRHNEGAFLEVEF